ncbi:hypothetical protein [Ornithinimicrobium kibberense]|uniref:hypothetical protein n=1 Tax=Ornithinimicrobium kibberense TaxID=282060 RepID=UPI00361D9FCB
MIWKLFMNHPDPQMIDANSSRPTRGTSVRPTRHAALPDVSYGKGSSLTCPNCRPSWPRIDSRCARRPGQATTHRPWQGTAICRPSRTRWATSTLTRTRT